MFKQGLPRNLWCRSTQASLHGSLNLCANCNGIDASRYCNGRQNWTRRKAKLDRCWARSQGRTANRGTRCSVTQEHQASQSEQQKRCERSSAQGARCPNQIVEEQLYTHCIFEQKSRRCFAAVWSPRPYCTNLKPGINKTEARKTTGTTREVTLHTAKWLFTRGSVVNVRPRVEVHEATCSSHLTAWPVPLQQLMQQEKRPLPLRGMYGPAWNAQLRACV